MLFKLAAIPAVPVFLRNGPADVKTGLFTLNPFVLLDLFDAASMQSDQCRVLHPVIARRRSCPEICEIEHPESLQNRGFSKDRSFSCQYPTVNFDLEVVVQPGSGFQAQPCLFPAVFFFFSGKSRGRGGALFSSVQLSNGRIVFLRAGEEKMACAV